MIMKDIKQMLSLAAMLLACAGCAQKEEPVTEPAPQGEGRQISLSREVFVKSTLDGDAAKWTAGDEVAVFQSEGSTAKKFTAAASGTTSVFNLSEGETALSQTGNYFLVYPYSAAGSSTVSSSAITLTIPAAQTAVKGSFDPAAAIAVASGTDCSAGFSFKNAHTLFKVTVPENFGADIASISISANTEGEKIAGECSFTFASEPVITPTSNAVGEITLSGKDGAALEPGDYYIVASPASVAAGINANYIGTDGRVYFRYSTQPVQFKRNTIYDLGALVAKAGTTLSLNSKYYTEGESYVYGGRENNFPATVSDITGAAFTSLPEGWNARLESDRLVVIPATDSEAGTYSIQLFAYAEGAKADIYTFTFKYDPTYILYDDFAGSDIDDRYWKRFNEYTSVLWSWFQTGEEAQSPVADGKLQLKATYEDGTYKTGAITGKDVFTYEPPFRIDCRAAMSTRATGFWCAIWTVPTTGYQNGEIDIMEAGNHYSNSDFASKAYYTCHTPYTINTPSSIYDSYRPGQDQAQSGNSAISDQTGYHTYSVEVTDEAVIWYVDGTEVHRYKNIKHTISDKGYKYAAESTTNSSGETIYPKANYLNNYPFTRNTYFAIMDIAVGGSFVGGTNDKTAVTATEGFSAQFDIDWIKISKIN